MKNAFIFILIVILCVAAWWIFFNPPKPNTIQKTVTEYVKLEVDDLDRETNEKGVQTVIADVTDKYLTQAGLKTATDSAGIIDSLQKLANNRLISYTQARAQIKRYEAIMAETDTSFTYKDKWLTVDVKKPLGSRPPLLTSTYNAELNWMWYRERRHFLAPLRTYGRFSLNDPNARIMGVKHIRIEPPRDRLGITLMAVGEYYGGEALIGGGVSVDIGRFRVQGNYLYDGQQWQPAIRTGFKLVDW